MQCTSFHSSRVRRLREKGAPKTSLVVMNNLLEIVFSEDANIKRNTWVATCWLKADEVAPTIWSRIWKEIDTISLPYKALGKYHVTKNGSVLYRRNGRMFKRNWFCLFDNYEELKANVEALTVFLDQNNLTVYEDESKLAYVHVQWALRCVLKPITTLDIQGALSKTEMWKDFLVFGKNEKIYIIPDPDIGDKPGPALCFNIPQKMSVRSEVSLGICDPFPQSNVPAIDSLRFAGLEGDHSLLKAMTSLKTKYAVCSASVESSKPRSRKCMKFVEATSPGLCSECSLISEDMFSKYTPIKYRSPAQLQAEVRSKTKEVKQLKRQMARQKARVARASKRAEARGKSDFIDIHPNQSERLQTCLQDAVKDLPSDGCEDLKALVKAQQKVFEMKKIGAPRKSIRWHPHVIRFTLLMVTKGGNKSINALRTAGLELPSGRTIRRYRNLARLTTGESASNIELIKKRLDNAREAAKEKAKEEHREFNERAARACILFVDGMKIKNGIHYDRSIGRVVGFDTLDDEWSKNQIFAHFEQLSQESLGCTDEDEIDQVEIDQDEPDQDEIDQDDDADDKAEQTDNGSNCDGKKKVAPLPIGGEIYVWMVKTPYFKFHHVVNVENVGTVTASRVLAMFLQTVQIVEKVGLNVVALVWDGASPHRALIETAAHTKGDAKYFKIRSQRNQSIWILSDYVHLLKRLRNALYNRDFMEVNGERLSWDTIRDTWQMCDATPGNSLIPKVRHGHIFLDPWSKMNVAKATQVMSRSMAAAIKATSESPNLSNPQSHPQLRRFILQSNEFFDAFNKQPTFHMPPMYAYILDWEEEAKELWEQEKAKKKADKAKEKAEGQKKRVRTGNDDAENDGSLANKKKTKTAEEKKAEVEAKEQRVIDKKRAAQSPMPTCLPSQLRNDLKMTLASTRAFYEEYVGEDKLLPSLLPKQFCQDILENFFSRVREACGAEKNPQHDQVMSAISSLHQLFELEKEYDNIKSASGNTNCN